jgi:steroid 5-alpha reductase family enzyme
LTAWVGPATLEAVSFAAIYLGALPLILGGSALLWAVSVRLRNVGIVDLYWGIAFLIAGWHYHAATGAGPRGLLVMTLVTIWGLRLSAYLFWRNHVHGDRAEDFRYREFRRRFGPAYWWISFFQVFALQGVLAWLISAPLLGAQIGGGPLGIVDALATALWLVGFVFEAGSDLQLARFRARRRSPSELLTGGFWRYTRHPNYFGDAACWWAYGLFSIAAGSPFAALGAALFTLVLIRVSGVRLLEKTMIRDNPGYAEYARRTSSFIPWPPRA